MRRIVISTALVLLATLGSTTLYARLQGQERVDSLIKELPKQKEDTNKVKLLISLCYDYVYVNQNEGLKYGNMALELAEKLKWEPGKRTVLMYIGRNYWRMGNYPAALKAHFAVLELFRATGSKERLGEVYTQIGQDYADGGNFPDALKYFSLALETYKATGQKDMEASMYNLFAWVYGNMGNFPECVRYEYASIKLYEELGDEYAAGIGYANIAEDYMHTGGYKKALTYLLKGIKGCEKYGDPINAAIGYSNIGKVYFELHNYAEARKYYNIALEKSKAINDDVNIAVCYGYIGSLCMAEGNYAKALNNYLQAIARAGKVSNKIHLAEFYIETGSCYLKMGRNNEAKKSFDTALSLSKELNSLNNYVNYYEGVVLLDSTLGNWQQAFENHKWYIRYRDSVYNKENSMKILQSQMQYDFDKKEAAAKAIQERKNIQQRNIRNTVMGGMAGLLVFSIVIYRQRNKVKRQKARVEVEKARSDELLLNILPAEVAEELKTKGTTAARHYDNVTVLFTDFVNFTQAGESMSPQGLIDELHACFKAFDEITSKYNIEKIKTIGDAYLAVCGLPTTDTKHAENVVRAATEINAFMQDRLSNMGSEHTFAIRIGIHSGSVVAGIVGVKKFAYDIWGDTVNTAARMEQHGEAGKINISQTTYELVKDKFTCEYRGEVEAKGKGVMKMYFVSE